MKLRLDFQQWRMWPFCNGGRNKEVRHKRAKMNPIFRHGAVVSQMA